MPPISNPYFNLIPRSHATENQISEESRRSQQKTAATDPGTSTLGLYQSRRSGGTPFKQRYRYLPRLRRGVLQRYQTETLHLPGLPDKTARRGHPQAEIQQGRICHLYYGLRRLAGHPDIQGALLCQNRSDAALFSRRGHAAVDSFRRQVLHIGFASADNGMLLH